MARKKNYMSHKGIPVDIDALRAKNEKTVAVGNMGVNAKGDTIKGGLVIETASKRVRTQTSKPVPAKSVSVKQTKEDSSPVFHDEQPVEKAKKPSKKKTETELDNGDIIVEE